MPDRPTSSFSRSLAAALRGYMRERGISQRGLADHIKRSPGFVSEHLSGHRAVDSDMLDAVAELAGIDTRLLVEEVNRRMSNLTPDPPPPGPTADRIVKKARADVNTDKNLTKPSRRRKRGA